MKKFQSPNHTQVPNDLFDEHMKDLSHAELKILLAIIRKTLGFHRRKYRLSLTDLVELTGLARSTVQRGCESLAGTGLVKRIQDGGVTQWEIDWQSDPPDVGGVAIPKKGTLGSGYTEKRYTPIPKKATPSIKESLKESEGSKKSTGDRPPAVELCKRILFRFPHKSIWNTIDRKVGREFSSLLVWGRTLREWKLKGYNPTNYDGMLDCFSRNGKVGDEVESSKDRKRFLKGWHDD